MEEKEAPREECLYCHNLASSEFPCPACATGYAAQARATEAPSLVIVRFDPDFMPVYP